MKQSYDVRPLTADDRNEYGFMVHASFNAWYWRHGWGRDYFQRSPSEAAVFFGIYNDLMPGWSVALFNTATGQLHGACFYHPRERHVSLGIMSVHPSFSGRGVGRAIVREIVRLTEAGGYPALRLVSSAINMDSFALYNRAGLVPHQPYHDMIITVPATGASIRDPARNQVRPAVLTDVAAMAQVEDEVSGIRREMDYRYAIQNSRGVLRATILEAPQGGLDGWMIAVNCPALKMLGPCVAKSEEAAATLIAEALDWFAGHTVLCLIPMNKQTLVHRLYSWGGAMWKRICFKPAGRSNPLPASICQASCRKTG